MTLTETDRRVVSEDVRHRGKIVLRTAARATDHVADERERQTEAMLLPADILGGDESIIFVVKPSRWFVLFDAANWAIAALSVVACATWFADFLSVSEPQIMSVALAVLALRVGMAILRWASRFYVLTNRRVMHIRGVMNPEIRKCLLVRVRNTSVTASFPEAMTGLGTISFAKTDANDEVDRWDCVANPKAVHAEIRKAIERAIDCQPHI
jgi:Bacterial PH domain